TVVQTCALPIMDRNRQHARIVPECLFDPVTVVGINIDVGHPFSSLIEHPLNGQGRVVINTKPRSRGSLCVMHTAGEVDGSVDLTVPDGLTCCKGSTGDPGG